MSRRIPRIVSFMLSGLFLGGFVWQSRSGLASPGEKPMTVSRVIVDHVRVTADKPFDKMTTAFEQQLGQFNPEAYQLLASGEDADKVKAKIEAMAGPSGFMLFKTS